MQALIVEFDPLFLGGFALPAKVLEERLKRYGVEDDRPYRFVREIYGQPFTDALEKLLPQSIHVAHVERRLAAMYTALLQQNAQQAFATLKSFFSPLAKQGVRFTLVTRLRQTIVSELFDSIASEALAVFDPKPLSAGITPDILQAAILAAGVPSSHCYGLFACGYSVRSAVRIGLRSVAVPDEMVSFESFVGAERVFDHMGKTLTKHLLARVNKK